MVDRTRLDEIILKNDTNDWWQPKLFVKNTKHLLPPELDILANPPIEERNYNCFIHAFGLADNPEIIKETNGFIYDSLVLKLIEVGELTTTAHPSDGDYIVYQDLEHYPSTLTHIGVLDGDKIISKWAWGPLVKHNLWDVPKEYGESIFYIHAITPEKAADLYRRYKQHNQCNQNS